ncbi:MAG: ATP-binding protein [Deltaproteobacteria bacterium]|nr:MAG: ATP-binding protein [Deltaproteobacteria bacterium]
MINPFQYTIVTDPWNLASVDVHEINASAFQRCCEALDRVRAEGRSTSVLLYGEAGSGKTHLLARLRSYLKNQAHMSVFVAVRLHTSPNRFWRHLRKSFVESLLRIAQGNRSQLEFVFMRRLYLHSRKKHLTLKQLRQDIDELSVEADLSWNVSKAIENLVRKRHRRDSVAWLKGDLLPSTVLEKIGLAPGYDEMEDVEDQACEIVKELCRLAGPTIPVVICFDQVEALQRYPRDVEGLFTFGQAIRSLHDETNNVLLVSCLQSFFLEQLKTAVTQPDYAALAINESTLNPLTFKESLKLVKARIDSCAEISELRDSLYTEFETKLKEVVWMKTGRTAREVLARCADLFEAWGKSKSLKAVYPEPKLSDAEFLADQITFREERAIQDIQPEHMEEVIQDAVPVLVHVLDENWSEQDQNRPRDIDIILESPNLKVAISLCNQQSLRSLAGRFKRLGNQIREDNLDKIFVIRHPELPISLGAKKTRKYLERLKQHKAVFYSPDIELIAALEALRSLLADAKAGDLSNNGNTVSSSTVINWLKKTMNISVLAFIDQIIGESDTTKGEDFEIMQDLRSLLEEERVIKLVDAALKLATDPDTLQTLVREFPRQIGLLQGQPSVLFQFIPESVRG